MNSSQIEELLNTPDEAVKSILSTILIMNVWTEESERNIISGINKLLSVSKTRLQGLEFLNLVVNNCSKTVISENAITWISHCLVKYQEDELKELKMTTVGRIISNSYAEQDFNKRFVSQYISKVFDMCLLKHSSVQETEIALETLAICIKYYGSWFAPHKLRIESFITNFLESPSEIVVENAALVFHYSQQIGGAGIDGINHKTNFSKNFGKLCATTQKLFDKFFENETELDVSDKPDQEVFEFADLPHYTQKMLHINTRRVKNCLRFIKTMLLKGFPVEKEIIPLDVLDIVVRGTAIHRCLNVAKENSLPDFQFSISLNQVQIELLQLLHILIVWLDANALPYSFTITKILIDCLNKTQNCECLKVHGIYQETVYKVLSCWVRTSRGAIHTHFQTKLVKCILKDITLKTSTVTLSLQNDVNRNKSKKARQKAIREKIISSNQTNISNGELPNGEKISREKACTFALDTLKHLLIGTILQLPPPNVTQELYETTITTLTNIQISKIDHPYTNPKCQERLYEVLAAFYEQDTLKTLPPLQLSIDILNRGLNSVNGNIASICERGLSCLEKICQPICPSLFISYGSVLNVKKSASFLDEEFVSSSGDENGSESEQFHENETGGVGNGKSVVEDESVEEEVDKREIRQNSVHIIDVQILKTSDSVSESEPTVYINDIPLSAQENGRNIENGRTTEEITQMKVSPKRVKEEMTNQVSINVAENEEIGEVVAMAEPPSKKFKIEETSRNEVEETVTVNEEDDTLQEEYGLVCEFKDD